MGCQNCRRPLVPARRKACYHCGATVERGRKAAKARTREASPRPSPREPSPQGHPLAGRGPFESSFEPEVLGETMHVGPFALRPVRPGLCSVEHDGKSAGELEMRESGQTVLRRPGWAGEFPSVKDALTTLLAYFLKAGRYPGQDA